MQPLSLSLSLFLLLSLICKNQNGLNGSQHGFARKESVQKLSTLRWGTRFIRWVRLALREMITAPQSVRDCPKYIIIVHTLDTIKPPPPTTLKTYIVCHIQQWKWNTVSAHCFLDSKGICRGRFFFSLIFLLHVECHPNDGNSLFFLLASFLMRHIPW